ncbi:hypothetical protein Tco_1336950 [Tanacetum coccineum]
MYCFIVSAIVSATSSSEYSWSKNELKSGNLNSSRLSVLKCLLDDQNSRSGSGVDVDTAYLRYWIRRIGVSWSRDHARIRRIFLDGYGVLVVKIVIFKISLFKLQNVRLLLIFTKYSVQNLQAAVQHRDVLIQQLQTLVAKMSSREGTLMQCILGLDRRLADVDRRSLGPQ